MKLINSNSEYAKYLQDPQYAELLRPLNFVGAANQPITFDKDSILFGISARGVTAAGVGGSIGTNDNYTVQMSGTGFFLIQVPTIGTSVFGDGTHPKPDWRLEKPMFFAAAETLNVIVAALVGGISRVDFVFHTLNKRS